MTGETTPHFLVLLD